jgi:hypothetical protein
MEQNQALKVLLQAATVAQTRGAYSLQEAGAIAQAVAVFTVSSSTNVEDNTNKEENDGNSKD